MKPLTVLKKAQAFIEAGRWIKGNFFKHNRRINLLTGKRYTSGGQVMCFCASGAIRVAGKEDVNNYERAEQIFLKAIGHEGGSQEEIWDWNDNNKRTVREVRAAFRKAIKIAEKQAV